MPNTLYINKLLENKAVLQMPERPGFLLPSFLQYPVQSSNILGVHQVKEIQEDTTITLRLLRHLVKVEQTSEARNIKFLSYCGHMYSSVLGMGACCRTGAPHLDDLLPYTIAGLNLLGSKHHTMVERGVLHREVRKIKTYLGYDTHRYKCVYCAADTRIVLSKKILRWVGLEVWTRVLLGLWNCLLKACMTLWPVSAYELVNDYGISVTRFIDVCLERGLFEFRVNLSRSKYLLYGPPNTYFVGGNNRWLGIKGTVDMLRRTAPRDVPLTTAWASYQIR